MNLLDTLLEYYKISKDEFDYISRPINEISLFDVSKIPDIEKIINRVNLAIDNKEKIIVYGDYDCDGICSTSIVVKTFELLNYPVSYYIPSRYLDGYGLNIKNVEKIAEKGYKLIITVDNGISANEAIDRANELGIDVIVIDHHEVPPEMVNAIGIIHPIVSHISSIIGSGGYMSLFFSRALLNRYDDYLVTLAGLSTISDLMELKDYNRDVVRLALDNFANKKYYALSLLKDNKLISEKTFALEIAPKINAVGRIKEDTSVNNLVEFLTTNDRDRIEELAIWIKEINEERKNLTKDALANLTSLKIDDGICIKTDLKEGLIGLIANRLLNEYKVPAIVFTVDQANPKLLKGSIRSKEGFNVTKAFASLDKYLVSGGGHALAGGLAIKESDFSAFQKDFMSLCKQHKLEEDNKDYIEISCYDITKENYNIIKKFSPFGMGYEEPSFVIQKLPSRGLSFISYGKHLSTQLSLNSKLLGFNMNERDVKKNPFIDIYGHFNESEFRGYVSLEFRIDKYNPSK